MHWSSIHWLQHSRVIRFPWERNMFIWWIKEKKQFNLISKAQLSKISIALCLLLLGFSGITQWIFPRKYLPIYCIFILQKAEEHFFVQPRKWKDKPIVHNSCNEWELQERNYSCDSGKILFKSKCLVSFNGVEDKYGCYRTDLGNEDEYFT